MSVKSQLRKRIQAASILLLIVVAVLAGCGTIRTYYASLEMHDEDNPARNSRPLKDRYAIEIAQRFGLMALFSTVAYRNDLDDLRESHGIESDCNYKDNWGFGMPQVEGNGRWMRLQSIPATSVLDTSVGCLDDRKRGLFYETYVYRSGDGMFEEAVIVYRGTENVSGQLLSDWSANLSAFLGFEPEQYKIARQNLPKIIDTLKRLNQGKHGAREVQIFVTGHSLGGGLAQQAGYLSPDVLEVFTFNTSPVTNWSSLRLDHQIANNYPVIFRLYHIGEALDPVRTFTTATTSSRFGRYDIGVQIEPKSRFYGHAVQIFTCEFANRLVSNGDRLADHHYPESYARMDVLRDTRICSER